MNLPTLGSSSPCRAAVQSFFDADPLSELNAMPLEAKLAHGIAHTPGEIAQQPDTWLVTLQNLIDRQAEIKKFLSAAGLEKSHDQKPMVFLIGAGTSDYIGRCLHHLLRQQWGCNVAPVASTELLTNFSDYLLTDRNYLWISFSRSGESPESAAVLERALMDLPAVHHIVISCNAAGRMIQAIKDRPKCLGIVLDDATNDRGLAMTSSFTNMVLAGQILAHAWSLEQFQPLCVALSNAGREFLPVAAEVAAQLANDGYRRACFVGSGALAGAASESALKLLELTAGKVKTMSETTLALRHGPMAALDQETLLVSFLSAEEPRRSYDLALLREIGEKRVARTRLVVAACGSSPLPAQDADLLVAPKGRWDIPDLYRPVLDIAFGQLLGLFFSLQFGLAPDFPSPDGVISRVVQNIEIYP